MGGFFGRRSVWVPALAAWLVLGIGLGVWVTNLSIQRYGRAAADAAIHRTGTTAPADMPSDFPIYPRGHVVEAFTAAVPRGTEGVYIQTPDPEATVFAFYNAVLKQGLWRVNLSVSYPLREISCLHVSSPELSCSLVVVRSRSGKTTLVTFEWVPLTTRKP
jgi:hypothetical protein